MPKKVFVVVVIAVIIVPNVIFTQIIHELGGFLRFLLWMRNWISLKASWLTQLCALIHLGSHICSHLSYCRCHAAQSCCVMPSRHLSAPYESYVTHILRLGPEPEMHLWFSTPISGIRAKNTPHHHHSPPPPPPPIPNKNICSIKLLRGPQNLIVMVCKGTEHGPLNLS